MSETLLFDQMIQEPAYRSLAETIATSNSGVDPLLGLSARVVTYEDEPPVPPSHITPPTGTSQHGGNVENPVNVVCSNDYDTLLRVLSGLRHLDEPRQPVAAPATVAAVPTPAVWPVAQGRVPVIPGDDRRRVHIAHGQAPVVERRYSASARAAVRPAAPRTDERTDEWRGYPSGESERYADGVRKMTEDELSDRMKAFYGINEKSIQEPDHYQGRRRRESRISELLRSGGRFVRRLGVLATGTAVAFAASDVVANHLSR